MLILRHEAYVNPIDFVLKNDHVTFMGMSETYAWFRWDISIRGGGTGYTEYPDFGGLGSLHIRK